MTSVPLQAVTWTADKLPDRYVTRAKIAGGVAAVVAALWFLSTPAGLGFVLLVTIATGIALGRQAQSGTRWFPRRVWLGTLEAVLLAGMADLLGVPVLAVSIVVLLGYSVLAWRLRPEPVEPHPLDNDALLTEALVGSKVLTGPGPHSIGFEGIRGNDDRQTWRTLRMPAGTTHEDVGKRRAALATWLNVATDQLSVEHYGDRKPDNWVTLRIDNGTPAPVVTREVVLSPVAAMPRTDARQPVRIGTDRISSDTVHLPVHERNTIVGGLMGYGKTVCLRILLAHYLLDPDAIVYFSDGKSSRRDYRHAAPLCERFVWGADEDAAAQLCAMLRDVLALVRHRNANDHEDAVWPPVLLGLEEFQDIRAGATRAEQEDLDVTLGRIVRMGRAVQVHVVIATQRPTADDLSTGVRNLLSNRVALALRGTEDSRIVLGHSWPKDLPTPSKPGEAVYFDMSQDRAVQLDNIDPQTWRQVCERAALLRAKPVALVKSSAPSSPDPAPVVAPVATLHSTVLALLATGPMTNPALLQSLPEHLRPASALSLGKTLGTYPELTKGYRNGSRVWLLAPVAQPSSQQVQEAAVSVNGRSDKSPVAPVSDAVRGAQ